jgi:hypothetical protein
MPFQWCQVHSVTTKFWMHIWTFSWPQGEHFTPKKVSRPISSQWPGNSLFSWHPLTVTFPFNLTKFIASTRVFEKALNLATSRSRRHLKCSRVQGSFWKARHQERHSLQAIWIAVLPGNWWIVHCRRAHNCEPTFSGVNKLGLEDLAQLFSLFSHNESKALSKRRELCKVFWHSVDSLGIILRIYLVSPRVIRRRSQSFSMSGEVCKVL